MVMLEVVIFVASTVLFVSGAKVLVRAGAFGEKSEQPEWLFWNAQRALVPLRKQKIPEAVASGNCRLHHNIEFRKGNYPTMCELIGHTLIGSDQSSRQRDYVLRDV